jgi:hypothetical protein
MIVIMINNNNNNNNNEVHVEDLDGERHESSSAPPKEPQI